MGCAGSSQQPEQVGSHNPGPPVQQQQQQQPQSSSAQAVASPAASLPHAQVQAVPASAGSTSFPVATAEPVSASNPTPNAATSSTATNGRSQQEIDDEALARRLAMEELGTIGASRWPPRLNGSSSSSRSQVHTVHHARATCPTCSTQNEFSLSTGGGPVTIQCGSCMAQFQVSVPVRAGSMGGEIGRTSVQLCRNCGTMNQFQMPSPGQPWPEVRCGLCGAVARSRRHRSDRTPDERLVDQMLLGSQARGNNSLVGPMVRVNIGGQRRMVPLALLLALMAEEGDHSNPAQAADIAALPTRKCSSTENLGEQTKCLICLEEFGDGDDIKTLPCLHLYHQKCIERWLGTDNSCPICKTPINGSGGGGRLVVERASAPRAAAS
eukprot:gnl/TRDRNA2_/TRDRNA2_88199_c0_seq1.p1 gnl/TRDRNA2_/TRDRNA2_88199_c0~~gnl/TRDRNA2_/TRDRNA2_88199_c0_seq1.p1  ORF type:complete len:403 (-),score=47.99 gnl/TRDRNA2_/TRDRNA2_88199_c0_seq1:58-1200(-)